MRDAWVTEKFLIADFQADAWQRDSALPIFWPDTTDDAPDSGLRLLSAAGAGGPIPFAERDASRLLVVRRDRGEIRHASFRELAAALDENDVLVVNDTRVFPARLTGHKDSGGKVELLLHHLPEAKANGSVPQGARARATHRGRLKVGQILNFGAALTAAVLDLPAPGVAEVRFSAAGGDAVAAVLAAGEVPLPPYIQRPAAASDRETYQTVFAAPAGAVACPTAGLHFTGSGSARPGRPGGRDRPPHPARGAGDVFAGASRRLYPAPDAA